MHLASTLGCSETFLQHLNLWEEPTQMEFTGDIAYSLTTCLHQGPADVGMGLHLCSDTSVNSQHAIESQ